MKVLFEFSRSGLPKYKQHFDFIRKYLIENDHILTNDLIAETKQRGIKGSYANIINTIKIMCVMGLMSG